MFCAVSPPLRHCLPPQLSVCMCLYCTVLYFTVLYCTCTIGLRQHAQSINIDCSIIWILTNYWLLSSRASKRIIMWRRAKAPPIISHFSILFVYFWLTTPPPPPPTHTHYTVHNFLWLWFIFLLRNQRSGRPFVTGREGISGGKDSITDGYRVLVPFSTKG